MAPDLRTSSTAMGNTLGTMDGPTKGSMCYLPASGREIVASRAAATRNGRFSGKGKMAAWQSE